MSWFSLKKKSFDVVNLNDSYFALNSEIEHTLTNKLQKVNRKRSQKRCYVIDFDGDVMVSTSRGLTLEVSAILCNAQKGDEVLIRLKSPGGAAHAYGYAASQLARFKQRGIKLTVSVDMIAASGGYMMACVADKIVAAPFAIIGSIGVVSEFPNFNSFLKNLGIDYRQYTAGKYKRTVSPMGEITQEGEDKFKKDLGEMYDLFREHVKYHRPNLDMDVVATGEHWQAVKAIDLGLVDEIATSEEHILNNLQNFEFVRIGYVGDRKGWLDRVGENLVMTFFDRAINYMSSLWMNSRFMV